MHPPFGLEVAESNLCAVVRSPGSNLINPLPKYMETEVIGCRIYSER